jgi:putative transposase
VRTLPPTGAAPQATATELLEVVKRVEGIKSFHVLPKEWIVERTFGWPNRYRRLSKDYKLLSPTRETMLRVATMHLMIRLLARSVSC